MARFGLTVTDGMSRALKQEAKKRGATVGNLIRMYIEQGLIADGHKVEDAAVTWGGDRRTKAEKQP